MERAITHFPKARYFSVMGELAENYGGTSNVLFHRSNIIAEHIKAPYTILTFGHLRDYAQVDTEMHADGRLSEYVHFRNMWDELACVDASSEMSASELAEFEPLTPEQATEVEHGDGVPTWRIRKSEDGKILQSDMLRSDGTVILSDRRDLRSAKGGKRRSLILCDTRGRPIRAFASLHAVRQHWLDMVVGNDTSVMFSDSFRIARTMHGYRRPHVTVIQTFHNNHSEHAREGAFGYTKPDYMTFLRHIDEFDAAVVLSRWQLEEIDELLGEGANRWVVPNSRALPDTPLDASVSRTDGAMVGRLVAGKQCDHAVEAVVRANRSLASAVSLEIFGEGPDRQRVEERIEALGASTVTLHGYTAGAAEEFSRSAFSVLTSSTEAFSLVLVESMSRGCVPICYDVRYGPRDIIESGKDGFLVEPDDIDGLAAAIERVQSMSEKDFQEMRVNAVKKAQVFSDRAALKRWSKVVRKTAKKKLEPRELTLSNASAVISQSQNSLTLSVAVEFEADRRLVSPRSYLVLSARGAPAIMRLQCHLSHPRGTTYRATATVDSQQLEWMSSETLDVKLDVSDRRGWSTQRVASDGGRYALAFHEAYPTKHGNLSLKPCAS